ncbi:MAG: putative toxin-antitoxin system toxin component, PIN family [Candidatus Eisenbacteria bacterium]|nr:putative toxin-antitoxin system toxin component, PIN family [Candidatus Eisenbacteria bacterium]
MRVVLDTNVFVSGVFFRGAPYRILSAWRDGRLVPVFSVAIVEEYQRAGEKLGQRFPEVDLSPFLSLLLTSGSLCWPRALPRRVCQDPDDDKFISCALEGKCKNIVSGDVHLVTVSGYHGITVWRPRAFVDRFLTSS